jgi:hypothetical protein
MKTIAVVIALSLTAFGQTWTKFTAGPRTWVYGINDSGQVSGTFSTSNQLFIRNADGTILRTGYTHIQSAAINNSAEVAGSDGNDDGYYYIAGVYTEFGEGYVGAVNSSGVIAGTSHQGNRITGAYLYQSPKGQFFQIPFPSGATPEYVSGLNNSNEVVGAYADSQGEHGFLYDGALETIDMPGAVATGPQAINDNGEVAGWWSDGTTSHGFFWTASAGFTSFDVPGWAATAGLVINNSGVIAGSANDGEHNQGFTRTPAGKFKILSAPHSIGTNVVGINASGQVVGTWYTNTKSGPFIYTPKAK